MAELSPEEMHERYLEHVRYAAEQASYSDIPQRFGEAMEVFHQGRSIRELREILHAEKAPPLPANARRPEVLAAIRKLDAEVHDRMAEKDWESRNMIDIDPGRYAE